MNSGPSSDACLNHCCSASDFWSVFYRVSFMSVRCFFFIVTVSIKVFSGGGDFVVSVVIKTVSFFKVQVFFGMASDGD